MIRSRLSSPPHTHTLIYTQIYTHTLIYTLPLPFSLSHYLSLRPRSWSGSGTNPNPNPNHNPNPNPNPNPNHNPHKVLVWFRDYKTPDGKPQNAFGFDNKCMDAAFAQGVISETHGFYTALKSGKRANDEELSLN